MWKLAIKFLVVAKIGKKLIFRSGRAEQGSAVRRYCGEPMSPGDPKPHWLNTQKTQGFAFTAKENEVRVRQLRVLFELPTPRPLRV